MKNKDLVKKLQEFDPEIEVIVWEGYNAGFATGDIAFTEDTFSDTNEPFIRLEDDGS